LLADNSKYRPACTLDQDAERFEAQAEHALVTQETCDLAEQSMVSLQETWQQTHFAEYLAESRELTLLVAQRESRP
jgi:hypothetical protein